MIMFGRRFEPALWSVVLTLAGVSLFCSLGYWQLQRAAYKQDIETRFETRLQQDYRLYDVDRDQDDIQYRRLIFRGRYQPDRHFLLDNQTHQGRAGYHVLTPLLLNDSDSVLLVNRGWAPWGARRTPLPSIDPPVTEGEIAGIVHIPGEPALRLGEVVIDDDWPQLLPYLDLQDLRAQYSDQLLPFILWVSPDAPGSYVRDWDPVWLPPEKSRAYAVQWFSFAAIALLLFVILNLRKPE